MKYYYKITVYDSEDYVGNEKGSQTSFLYNEFDDAVKMYGQFCDMNNEVRLEYKAIGWEI